MKWHTRQVLATIRLTLTLWSKTNPRAQANGTGKRAINEQREGARQLSLVQHVTSVANLDTKQTIVGAMSVPPGERKAKAKARIRKAKTARTSKARVINWDLWTVLDKRKNPKLREAHLSCERLVHRNVESFNSLNRWNRYSEINKYKEYGYVKIKLGTGPKQNRHSKGHVTESGELIPDFGGARLKCTDELDVIHRCAEDLGKCFTSVQQRKTMLVVAWRWRPHRSNDTDGRLWFLCRVWA